MISLPEYKHKPPLFLVPALPCRRSFFNSDRSSRFSQFESLVVIISSHRNTRNHPPHQNQTWSDGTMAYLLFLPFVPSFSPFSYPKPWYVYTLRWYLFCENCEIRLPYSNAMFSDGRLPLFMRFWSSQFSTLSDWLGVCRNCWGDGRNCWGEGVAPELTLCFLSKETPIVFAVFSQFTCDGRSAYRKRVD